MNIFVEQTIIFKLQVADEPFLQLKTNTGLLDTFHSIKYADCTLDNGEFGSSCEFDIHSPFNHMISDVITKPCTMCGPDSVSYTRGLGTDVNLRSYSRRNNCYPEGHSFRGILVKQYCVDYSPMHIARISRNWFSRLVCCLNSLVSWLNTLSSCIFIEWMGTYIMLVNEMCICFIMLIVSCGCTVLGNQCGLIWSVRCVF